MTVAHVETILRRCTAAVPAAGGRGRLPAKTIVPIQLPAGPARAAADEIARELTAIGVQSADFSDMNRVRELAQV